MKKKQKLEVALIKSCDSKIYSILEKMKKTEEKNENMIREEFLINEKKKIPSQAEREKLNVELTKKVEKEYYVQVDGIINQEAIDKMKGGVEIGFNGTKYKTKKCKASLISEAPAFGARGKKIRDERHGPTSWASITVNEGKFRQIRKMTAAVGFPTLRLVRVRLGNVHLHNLLAGEVVEVLDFNGN
ncbi:MAG: hypothetical protein QMA99_00220 [Flavobacterium sp.]